MIKNSDPVLYKSFLTAQECHQRGDLASAEAIYSRLLALDPADDELLFLFGYLQASKGAVDVGLECLCMARQLKPDNPRISFAIGVVLQKAVRLQEAVEAYRSVLAIDPACREAWENLCAACYDLEDYQAGLEAAQQALKLDPASVLAVRGAANCLTAMGRRTEALAVLEQGLHFHPAQPELRIHHAWELMANGDFAAGWQELEWRNSRQGVSDQPPRSVPFPRWNGEELAGKTVLVYGEQGIGDEIMYAPFVLGILHAGGRCILECEQRLEKLFARAFPQCTLLRREEREQICWYPELAEVDYAISALSLPLYFDHPLQRGAFLSAEPERVAYWKQRLQAAGPGLKVGVSWRGGADAKARKFRSISPALFGSLIDRQATFVSLQYGATAEETASVSPALLHFAEVDPIRDMDEFAALVAALDCVVSIDNSTVHLAGALGVKTLMLLPLYSEWRWGNAESGESPWYRTVDLIRQRESGESGWQESLAEVRKRLACLLPAIVDSKFVNQKEASVLCPTKQGRSALLLADTHYWGHWGSACANLGIHEGLRQRFDRISVLPLWRLLSGCPQPTKVEHLDADDFFHQFEESCPDIAAQIGAVDYVVINGEGSLNDAQMLSPFLLYLGYVAHRRYGKGVALISAAGDSDDDFSKRVYAALNVAVARESVGFAKLKSVKPEVCLGFDCLPRFLASHPPVLSGEKGRKLILAGSASWNVSMVSAFAQLAESMHGHGYVVEILSGSKALLALEEIGFVEMMVRELLARQVPYELHFPLSERKWLEAIGSASLLVSGRVHESLAAAFQQVPFLVAGSIVDKMLGVLTDIGLPLEKVTLSEKDYGLVTRKANVLLDDRAVGVASPQRLAKLHELTEQNFSWL